MSGWAIATIALFAICLLSLMESVADNLGKIALRLDELSRVERARYSREQEMLDGVEADR